MAAQFPTEVKTDPIWRDMEEVDASSTESLIARSKALVEISSRMRTLSKRWREERHRDAHGSRFDRLYGGMLDRAYARGAASKRFAGPSAPSRGE